MENSIGLLLLFLLGSSFLSVIPVNAQSNIYSLHVEVAPPILPADGGKYPVYIMLIGPDDIITQAPTDIDVSLFISPPGTRIVELPSKVTIKKGEFYAKTYLETSTVPGQVVITAIANGVKRGEAFVEVVRPLGQPVRLAVYARPSMIPPYSDEKASITVRLEDGIGHPVKAPKDIHVRLTLSDTDLGDLPEEATIPKGSYQAELTFTPKGLIGTVTITASADGYEEGVTELNIKAPQPVALKLYAAPESIPADGESYGYLAITLVDEEGYPAPTEEDLKVFLSSANDAVITLETNMTIIHKGEYYTIVRFFSTGISGSSQITVHAEGLLPDSIKVSAVQPGIPTIPNKINLYVIPSILLPDESLHKGTVILQIINATGSPIKMYRNITFTLSSSGPRFGNVTRFITVPRNSNIGIGDFRTGHVPGSTKITATADGFEPGYFDVEVKTRPPTSLNLEMAPPIIRADGREYDVFVIQLLDSSGNPTRAINDTTVYLLPSDTTLIDLPSEVTIPAGRSFIEFSATTTIYPGELTIFAHSHDLKSATLSVNIEEPYPSDLRMVIEPSYTLADGREVDLILWVESSGVPAKLERPINISLFTTNPTIALPNGRVLHLPGNLYTISKLRVGEEDGWTNILAISNGFNPYQMSYYTVLLPMAIEFNTSATFLVGEPSPISLHVHRFGFGIPNAHVTFEAENGTILTDTYFTDEDGWLTFNYIPKVYGTNIINVYVEAKGYKRSVASFEVTATAYPTLTVSLIGAKGIPVKGVKVSVVAPNGTELTGITDETGTVVFKRLKVGDYKVAVPKENLISEKEMFAFSAWQNGMTENVLTVRLTNDTKLVANYIRKYFVLVNSRYGTVKGTGWYEEGSIATISISPEMVQLSLFMPPQRFSSWIGDIYSTKSTTSFVVDSPKIITAQWVPDYTAFAINIIPIVVIVAILISIPLLIRRRIKRLREEVEEELF